MRRRFILGCMMFILLCDRSRAAAPAEVSEAIVTLRGPEKAIQRLGDEREEMLEKLRQIVQKSKEDQDFPKFKYAILALGKMKAVEEIVLLIDSLNRADPQLLRIEEIGDQLVRPFELFPAAYAIYDLGPCAIPYLLDAIASGKLKGRQVRMVGSLIETWVGKREGLKRVKMYQAVAESDAERRRLSNRDLTMFFEDP